MRALLAAVGVTLLTIAACSDDSQGSEAAYCTEVGNSLGQLTTPNIATPSDVTKTVELYRRIRDSAPLAIEPEWDALVVNIETAASVVPNDAESVQRAADAARSSQQAAIRVSDYTRALCGVSLTGEIAPVAPVATG